MHPLRSSKRVAKHVFSRSYEASCCDDGTYLCLPLKPCLSCCDIVQQCQGVHQRTYSYDPATKSSPIQSCRVVFKLSRQTFRLNSLILRSLPSFNGDGVYLNQPPNIRCYASSPSLHQHEVCNLEIARKRMLFAAGLVWSCWCSFGTEVLKRRDALHPAISLPSSFRNTAFRKLNERGLFRHILRNWEWRWQR